MKPLPLAAASIALLLAAAQSPAAAQSRPPSPKAADAAAPKRFGTWGFDLSGRDTAVKPGDSFYDHANGGWFRRAQFDADLPGTGVTIDIYKLTQSQLRSVVEDSARAPKTRTAQKVGDLYASYMDEALLERPGRQAAAGRPRRDPRRSAASPPWPKPWAAARTVSGPRS
jgi:putative endopeptidase